MAAALGSTTILELVNCQFMSLYYRGEKSLMTYFFESQSARLYQ
jgi:hypothetical protein